MGVESFRAYHSDGRLRGSYVYMLLCQDAPGPVYVKVGITDTPTKRLMSLRLGCPVTPQRFAFCEVRSRKRALLVEGALHHHMKPWRAHGEWFAVPLEDKPLFNRAWSSVFAAMSENGWALKWEQMACKEFFRRVELRGRAFQRKYMTRGRAYRDFVGAGGACK